MTPGEFSDDLACECGTAPATICCGLTLCRDHLPEHEDEVHGYANAGRSGLSRCPACGYWAFDGRECRDCGYRRSDGGIRAITSAPIYHTRQLGEGEEFTR